MMRHKFWSVLAAVSAALLLPIASVHATETPEGELAFSINVPSDQLTVQDVHKVVVMASMGRDWNIKEDSEGRVVIYLNHRGSEATVTYLISDKQIQAYCVGYRTYNLGTINENRTPSQPKGWLGNLNRDITKGLQQAVYLKK
ncbi:hypothetical protein DW355_06510 [Hylemonella gracilis]|uniref:Lipoprotein n=2 Tax=Hylemonella gracilis TaxID=80880 RepID=A0A4P6UHS7_9BURK|nr:hypothetical protein DW355_06510 [Hylemonella gracilis]